MDGNTKEGLTARLAARMVGQSVSVDDPFTTDMLLSAFELRRGVLNEEDIHFSAVFEVQVHLGDDDSIYYRLTALSVATDTPLLSERQQQILGAIRSEGGHWSPRRVSDYVAAAGEEITGPRGLTVLRGLAELGYLEPIRARAYTYRLREGT